MKSLLPRFAFGLLAVLIIAAILITVGQRETYSQPSATSYNPSGLHAFQELLHRNGIRTSVTRLEHPRLNPTDLVIAAYVERGPSIKSLEERLERFLQEGGSVWVIPFDQDFRARSLTAIQQTLTVVSPSTKVTRQVHTAPLNYGGLSDGDKVSSGGATFLGFADSSATYTSWYKHTVDSGEPFISLSRRGKGTLTRSADGLFVTNRFLDRADNAAVALQTVRGMLPKGGRVVFAESALGGGIAPSLVTTLGAWAVGGWVQAAVLLLLVILTLGIRFGLPTSFRRRQQGQREMIDAIGFVYQRAKASSVALDVAYREADIRIRRGLKLPAHVSNTERDRLLPDNLRNLMDQADLLRKPIITIDDKGRQTVTHRSNPQEAYTLVKQLETALDEFVPKTKNRIS